jgi:hypothetical protein
MPPLPFGVVTLYVACFVPLVWWYTTARQGRVTAGRGVLGGALCGAALVVPPLMILTIALKMKPADGSAGLLTAAGYVVLILAGVVLAALGAGIGALASLLERGRA